MSILRACEDALGPAMTHDAGSVEVELGVDPRPMLRGRDSIVAVRM